MKLDKSIVERRLDLMAAEGIVRTAFYSSVLFLIFGAGIRSERACRSGC